MISFFVSLFQDLSMIFYSFSAILLIIIIGAYLLNYFKNMK